jgi:WD40 repeat protein
MLSRLQTFLIAIAIAIPLRAAENAVQPLPVKEVKRKNAIDFEKEILPILKANCLACHNQTSSKGDLVLETPQTMRKGGESGPAVTPGKPGESLLFQQASHQKRPLMPPKDNKVAASDLKPEELGLLKLWIEQGAKGEVRTSIPVEWRPLPKSIQPIYAVAVTRDGQYVACGRANGISIYHLPSAQLVTTISDPKLPKGSAHLDLVQSLDFSPDGALLASSAFREVKLWRREIQSKTTPLPPSNTIVEVSADGRFIALCTTNEIAIQDVRSGSITNRFALQDGPVSQLTFCAGNEYLAGLRTNGDIKLWSIREDKDLTNLPVQATSFTFVSTNALAFVGASNAIGLYPISGATNTVSWLPSGEKKEAKPVIAIAGSGDLVMSADDSGTVDVWDSRSAKPLRKLKQEAPVTALAISPDQKTFASAGSNKVVKLWSSEGKLIAELKGDRYAVEGAASAERQLTLAKNEASFQKSGLQAAEKEHTNQITRITKAKATNEIAEKTFGEKQKAFGSAKEAKEAAEKALATLETELQRLTNNTTSGVTNKATNSVALATNLTSTTTNASVTATNVASSTNKPSAELSALRDKIKDATAKVTSASNAWASAEKDFKKAELTRSISTQETTLATNALASAVKTLAETKGLLESADADEKKQQASLETAKQRASASESITRRICFSPDGKTMATVNDSGTVQTWGAQTGKAFDVYRISNGIPASVALDSTGHLLIAQSESVKEWSLNPAWKLERTIGSANGESPFADRVNSVRFSPNGKLLATGGGEPSRIGEIKIWKAKDGSLVRDLSGIHSDSVFSLDFSPDGKSIASGAADKFLRVSSVESGKLIRTFEGHTHHVLGVAWKSDGRTLASAGADGVLKTWKATTGERIKNIEGFGKEVTSTLFVGVGAQILASAGDGQLRLVKEGGEAVRSFNGASDFLYSSAATPDGKYVVAGGLDGVLRAWNGEDGKVIAEFGP